MADGLPCDSPERVTKMVPFSKKLLRRAMIVALFLVGIGAFSIPEFTYADSFDESPPFWEPLLWGGKVSLDAASQPLTETPISTMNPGVIGRTAVEEVKEVDRTADRAIDSTSSEHGLENRRASRSALREPPGTRSELAANPVEGESMESLPALALPNIPPLYLNPRMEGEGIWDWQNLPTAPDGSPLMYRTSYRPSVRYPNAVAHLLLFDMRRLDVRLYLGSGEPAGSKNSSVIEQEYKTLLVAVTNALWKQKHSGEGGTIFRGNVVKKLSPGLATLVVYKDGSTDVLEWNDSIPTEIVSDAKQLRHLIVKDGKVVDSVIKGGQRSDSEIGLGYLLVEDDTQSSQPYGGYGGYYGGYYGGNYGGYYGGSTPMHTSGEDWFIATRSAFGIRPDGNLVFAVGHHIGTKDLAKALVLAGCVRAVHGDANPHNCLANLYYNNWRGDISRRAKLSPDQKSTLDRYVDKSYTSDYFGLFLKYQGQES